MSEQAAAITTAGEGTTQVVIQEAAGTGSSTWTTLILDSSSVTAQVPGLLGGYLRSDLSAQGGNDVFVAGFGEGRNLLVGNSAANGAASALGQGVPSARQQQATPQAAIDTFMARDWSARKPWDNATTMTDSDFDALALPFGDDYFLDTGSGDQEDGGAD